jgi:hypothetical protein
LLEFGKAALGAQAQFIVKRNEIGIFRHATKPLSAFPAAILQWTASPTPVQSAAITGTGLGTGAGVRRAVGVG